MMKETKDVVIAVAKLAVAVDKTIADAMAGNTGIVKEFANFIPVLVAIPAAIKDCTKIPEEIANATAEDKADIILAFQTEDDAMPHDVAEIIIDEALDIVLSFWKLVGKVNPVLGTATV